MIDSSLIPPVSATKAKIAPAIAASVELEPLQETLKNLLMGLRSRGFIPSKEETFSVLGGDINNRIDAVLLEIKKKGVKEDRLESWLFQLAPAVWPGLDKKDIKKLITFPFIQN